MIAERFPNHFVTELDNLEFKMHSQYSPEDENSRSILVKAITEAVGAQNPIKGIE